MIGPNGAGKSILLKILNSLIDGKSGEVLKMMQKIKKNKKEIEEKLKKMNNEYMKKNLIEMKNKDIPKVIP